MNESLYIIIEYIDGKNLSEIVKSCGILDEKGALDIVLKLLDVLDYLHSIRPKPLIHGDIKPENILIENDRVVLIDFGSIDTEDASPGFCAPERFAGIPKSIESDLYSIGELLHFLLCGEIKKVYNKKQSTNINNDIYRIIDKSTSKLPGERYNKAAAMISEIHRLQELRRAGVNNENDIRIVCIPGCSEAACEIAYSICSIKRKVLIADLNMLSPSVHTIMGVDKFDYCLQDFMSDNPMELRNKSIEIKKSGLRMLPCRIDYENYESSSDNCLSAIITGASGFFNTIIISCSGFPYDKYFIDSLIYSNIVIFPVTKGIIDIRRFNSLVRFMCDRQNVPDSKMYFMGVDTYENNISPLIAAGAVETTWIGSIPRIPSRSALYSSGSPYVYSVRKNIYTRCNKLLKKTGVLS